MSKEAQKFLGTQVKELLSKAVGGIYISRHSDVMTDFYNKFKVTDAGLEITVNNLLTAKLPIVEDQEFINYSVLGETEDEEWDGSTYFDYKFEIGNYTVAFNVAENKNTLTWEQFIELACNNNYVNYSVSSIDGGSLSVDMNHSVIHFNDTNDSYFEVCSLYASIEVDKAIVDTIYNDTSESETVCYRIEFNNGMPDITIEPQRECKVF